MPVTCSGDMYMGVPTKAPVLVSVTSSKKRATPKSIRWTWP